MLKGTDENMFELSLTQRDIYMNQARHPQNPMYNIGGVIRLNYVDVERLKRAHAFMVNHHDAFGIRIHSTKDGVFQSISEQRDDSLPIVDFTSHANPEQAGSAWLDKLFATYVDIENQHLFRSYILKFNDNSFRYVSLAHHIAIDGWGFSNLARLVGVYYHNDQSEVEEQLTWSDVVQAEQNWVDSNLYEKSKLFWQKYLSEKDRDASLEATHLQAFDNKEIIPSQRQVFRFEQARVSQLKSLAEKYGVGIAQIFLSAISLYFIRVHQRSSFSIGVPVHNRNSYNQKRLIGVFTSISPLIVDYQEDWNFAELVKSVQQNQKQCFRHQRFPIGEIYRHLGQSQVGAGFFDVAFNYLHLDSDLTFDGKTCDLVYLSHQHEQLPLMFNVWEYGKSNEIELQLDHNLAYFNASEAQTLLQGIDWILAQVVWAEEIFLRNLSVVTPVQSEELTAFVKPGYATTDDTDTLVSMVEQAVRFTPDNIAVRDQNTSLTFEELNSVSNQLANHIIQNHSEFILDKESAVIGVCLERNVWLPVVLLAILKSGCAYVPLDPVLPKSRLNYIAENAGLNLILSNGPKLEIDGCTTFKCDFENKVNCEVSRPEVSVSHKDLAYVIYTSGSTGAPKGVEILHRNTVAMLKWARESFSEEQISDVLFSTSLNFDLSVFEIFLPLVSGNSCVVLDSVLSVPESQLQISLLNTVPSAIRALLDVDGLPVSLKAINLAGEALPRDLLNRIFEKRPDVVVRNLYGPSEDTTYSTEMIFETAVSGSVPIGKTISGTGFVVLDKRLKPLPQRAVGELFLCGKGVSRGYRNKHRLTQDKFLELSVFGLEETLFYRTGDMVKTNHQGNLLFYGRADEQLKINGFRIEPGEIETVIRQSGQVSDAVVVMKEISGLPKLVAYLICNGQFFEKSFKEYLSSRLPGYMVPEYIELLEEMPLNSNGKVDKKRLPEPLVPECSSSIDAQEWSKVERQILEIWQQLPGIGTCDKHTSFFSVGGSSLAAMSLLTRLNEAFGICLKVSEVFRHNTISQLTELVQTTEKHTSPEREVDSEIGRTTAVVSAAQRRFWSMEQLYQGKSPFNMAAIFELTGALDREKLQQSLDLLVLRHPMLRTIYVQDGDDLIQKVQGDVFLPIELASLQTQSPTIELNDCFNAALNEPFDLSKDVLLRVTLYTTPDSDKHFLRIVSHHIAVDGWSISLLLKDWSSLYNGTELPDVNFHYTDYAHLLAAESGDQKQQSLSFWRDYLHGAPVVHNLPLDRRRQAEHRHLGRRIEVIVPDVLSTNMLQACRAWKVTPFVFLKSAWALTLARFSNQADIVLGVPVAARGEQRLDNVLGAFVNTVCVRTQIDTQRSVKAWLQLEQESFLQVMQHQDLSFDELVQETVTDTNKAHTSLFQLLFDYAESASSLPAFGEVSSQKIVTEKEVLKYDLELYTSWQGDHLKAHFLYDEALFDGDSVVQFAKLFESLIQSMVDMPLVALHELPVMPKEEHDRLHSWNQIDPNDQPVPDIYEVLQQQFKSNSENVAFVTRTEEYTYQRCSNRIDEITLILQKGGIGKGDMVGLMMSRQVDLYLSMIALLRLGAAFVPLDPTLPEQRVAFIIDNCHMAALVSDGNIPDKWHSTTAKHLDISIPVDGAITNIRAASGDDIAYVLYTSGSTGSPKGVPITRDALTNLVIGLLKSLSLPKGQKWLAMTTVSFDISMVEWLAPLFAGDCCYMADDNETANPDMLLNIIDSKGVSMVSSTPSRWQQWFDLGWQGNTTITGMCAGELFPETLQKKLEGKVKQFLICGDLPKRRSMRLASQSIMMPLS